MERKLSVVIPIYNVEKYFCQCLDSIVNQTYRNLEIVLVDDGSPDNCGAICDEYAARDPRIIVIHKQNGGLAAAKNDGLKVVTGEWVTFIDADDWIETDLFEKVMDTLGDRSPDIIVEGGYYYAYPKKNVLELNVPEAFLYTEKRDIYTIMARIRTFGLPWDKLYRVDFLRDAGLVNDVDCKAFEDYMFNFQAYDLAKSILGVPYCGYYYRQSASGNAFTRGFNPNKPRYTYNFICKLDAYIKEHGMETEMADMLGLVSIQAINVSLNCYYLHPANPEKRARIEEEFNEMKSWPLFHAAIWRRSNHAIPQKLKVLQYSLRLPGTFPIRLLYAGNKWLRRVLTG